LPGPDELKLVNDNIKLCYAKYQVFSAIGDTSSLEGAIANNYVFKMKVKGHHDHLGTDQEEDELKKYDRARTSWKNKVTEITDTLSTVISEETFDKNDLTGILD